MGKKEAPYYIGSGILFGIAGAVGKLYALAFIGLALIVIGFVLKNEKSN